MKNLKSDLQAYNSCFLSIPLCWARIDSLRKAASQHQERDVVDDMQSLSGAFYEFYVFIESIKRPFFEMLRITIPHRIGSLFSILRTKTETADSCSLTYEEAFVLLLMIGKGQVREILDAYKCNSYAYNGILDAVARRNYEDFLASIGREDYKDLMSILWRLRYIVLGVEDIPFSRETDGRYRVGRIDNYVEWNKKPDFSYVKDYMDKEESSGEKGEEIKSLGTINLLDSSMINGDGGERNEIKSCGLHETRELRRQRRFKKTSLSDDELQQLSSTTTIADGRYYSGWLDKYAKMDSDAFKSCLVEISNRKGEVLNTSDIISYLIYINAVTGEPTNDESVDDWYYTYGHYDYHDTDSLGECIIMYSELMLNIYDVVKDLLTDEEKRIIEWILGCSRYTNIFTSQISEGTTKEPVSAVEEVVSIDDDTNNNDERLPHDIYNRKRLKNKKLIIHTCKYLQEWLFEGANAKDVMYVFFGIGERPSKSLELKAKATKKDLCKFISYLFGPSKNIQNDTYLHFASLINKNGEPVFPDDPEKWKRNPPSGYASKEEKDDYAKDFPKKLAENSNLNYSDEEMKDLR